MRITAVLAATALNLLFANPAQSGEKFLLDPGWRFIAGDPEAYELMPGGQAVGKWSFLFVEGSQAGDEAGKFALPAAGSTGWKDAVIKEDSFGYRTGFGWYRTVLPDIAGPGRRIYLSQVDDKALVYLNGHRLAYHEGWAEPFEVELEKGWKEGGPNELCILCENTGGPGMIGPAVVYAGRGRIKGVAVAGSAYDDSKWRKVDLPHDFVVEGTFDPAGDRGHGYLPKGVGWYRKAFVVPASDRGRRIWLEFDGIYRDSVVWFNGVLLGRHQSGYTGFHFDVTDIVDYGGRNTVAVRCDSSANEGWWYEGGGIYRHAWLTKMDPLHVDRWGVFVTTPKVTKQSARTGVRTAVVNDGTAARQFTLVSTVVDSSGRAVGKAETRRKLGAGEKAEISQAVEVRKPGLWSPDAPNMYLLRTVVTDGKTVLDSCETPFGIRTVAFDPKRGFSLNGKPLKVKGTCNHQDFAGVGVALPDRLNWYKISRLKEMGSNSYRCSHHPPTPELLDACDRLGMLVMDENRRLGDSQEILGQVESMVRRDRNHPSIYVWSMCNEEGAQGTEAGRKQGQAIYDTISKWDGTRPVTAAMNNGDTWGKGISKVVDVQGCNYNPNLYDMFHLAYPKRPMIATETASSTTTRGMYFTDTIAGFCSSLNEGAEWAWRPVGENAWMSGGHVWTGFDYRGEPSPYDWPCISSHFGIMDTCGFPKDDWYYYKAWWGGDPVIHLFPHWNWGETPVEKRPKEIRCYSNCERVELLLNGKILMSQGITPNSHVSWPVQWTPGFIEARGYVKGKQVALAKVQTTGAPEALVLVPDRPMIQGDGEDVSLVAVSVLDGKGMIVPTADNEVSFEVTGPGKVIGVGNGNPSSHEPDKASKRKAFNGRCMVLVQSTGEAGTIRVTATAPGVKPATLDVRAEKAPRRPFVVGE